MIDILIRIHELLPSELQKDIHSILQSKNYTGITWSLEPFNSEIIYEINQFFNDYQIPSQHKIHVENGLTYYTMRFKNEDAIKLARISISKN